MKNSTPNFKAVTYRAHISKPCSSISVHTIIKNKNKSEYRLSKKNFPIFKAFIFLFKRNTLKTVARFKCGME